MMNQEMSESLTRSTCLGLKHTEIGAPLRGGGFEVSLRGREGGRTSIPQCKLYRYAPPSKGHEVLIHYYTRERERKDA